jgi:hypothetical protein
MSSSRRDFLKRGTLVALTAGVPLALTEKALGMGTSTVTAGLSLEAFKSQLGTSFLVNHSPSKVKLTLVDVTSFASRKQSDAGKEGFSLVFRGPQETTLKQGTYRIQHEQLGLFTFLIVPVGIKDTRGQRYEVVVNRLYA